MKSLSIFILAILAFMGFTLLINKIYERPPVGCAFHLITSNGEPITEQDIRAKPAVVYFGYTMCPDICPTTMADMQTWIHQLGKDADKLGFWFFTVDPEHDTPALMHDYLSSLPKNIVGITGDPAEVKRVIKGFNIAAVKVPGESGDYTYDHTASIILLRKGGRSYGIIPYQPEVGANSQRAGIGIDKLRQLIKDEYK